MMFEELYIVWTNIHYGLGEIQARRQGEEILLHVEGGNGSFQVRNLGSQKIKVED